MVNYNKSELENKTVNKLELTPLGLSEVVMRTLGFVSRLK